VAITHIPVGSAFHTTKKIPLPHLLTVVNVNQKPSIEPTYMLNSITKHRNRGLN
jgi:hypothetical protein